MLGRSRRVLLLLATILPVLVQYLNSRVPAFADLLGKETKTDDNRHLNRCHLTEIHLAKIFNNTFLIYGSDLLKHDDILTSQCSEAFRQPYLCRQPFAFIPGCQRCNDQHRRIMISIVIGDDQHRSFTTLLRSIDWIEISQVDISSTVFPISIHWHSSLCSGQAPYGNLSLYCYCPYGLKCIMFVPISPRSPERAQLAGSIEAAEGFSIHRYLNLSYKSCPSAGVSCS